MSDISPAVRKAWRSARQIRRYHENGGDVAKVDSNILPLVNELAPSIDYAEDESERVEGYPIEWATRRKSFKTALTNFRKEAEKAGYNVPEASKKWVSFAPGAGDGIPTPPASMPAASTSALSPTPAPPGSTPAPPGSAPAPPSSAPAPAPSAPAPAPSAPAPPPSAPAPPSSAPAPAPSAPAPPPSAPAFAPSTPAPPGSTPAPPGSTPAPPGSTPAPPGSTPAPPGSTPAPPSSAPAPAPSAPAPPPSAPVFATSTPAPPGSTPAPPGSTPAPLGSTPAPLGSVQQSIEVVPAQHNLPDVIWPLFDALVANIDTPGWRALQLEAPLHGCDFADVKFRCEFRLWNEVSDDAASLLAFASDWVRICPEALESLDTDCYGDRALHAVLTAYRSINPRIVPLRGERDSSSRPRLFSENPEDDRVNRGFVNHLREPYDGWDSILFEVDPDDLGSGEVVGKIKLSIAGWLDVALPSLNDENPGKERHILVRESDYPDAANRFSGTREGRNRTFKRSADKTLLRNKKRKDYIVVSHSCAIQGRQDLWPRTYTTAYLDGGDSNSLNVWSRTAWHYFGKSTVDAEINDSREEVGQERVSIAK